MPHARAAYGVAAVGQKLIYAGGTSTASGLNSTIDIYDTQAGTWDSHAISVPRYNPAFAVAGNKAIFAGGVGAGGNSNAVDIYDATTGTWSATTMPGAWNGMYGTGLGNLALFGGGWNGSNGDVLYIYDTQTGAWTIDHLATARFGIGTATVGNTAVFAGGYNAWGAGPVAAVDLFTTPEPATLSLLALGGLAILRRRARP
jgi:hypothetical protein